MDTLTETLSDNVTDNMDNLCENIMIFSPRGIEIGNKLDIESAYQITEELERSYPRRFKFYVNDDVENEGLHSIYSKYI